MHLLCEGNSQNFFHLSRFLGLPLWYPLLIFFISFFIFPLPLHDASPCIFKCSLCSFISILWCIDTNLDLSVSRPLYSICPSELPSIIASHGPFIKYTGLLGHLWEYVRVLMSCSHDLLLKTNCRIPYKVMLLKQRVTMKLLWWTYIYCFWLWQLQLQSRKSLDYPACVQIAAGFSFNPLGISHPCKHVTPRVTLLIIQMVFASSHSKVSTTLSYVHYSLQDRMANCCWN